ERDVAGIAERFDLPGEHLLISVVVADRGHDTRIGGERHRSERAPLALEPSDELRDEMLRVRGAAAVAKREQLSARQDGAGDRLAGRDDAFQPTRGESLM